MINLDSELNEQKRKVILLTIYLLKELVSMFNDKLIDVVPEYQKTI
jgi:hypothetical protein